MGMTESKNQFGRFYAKFLLQSVCKIPERVQRFPPAEICLDQNQRLSTSRRCERRGRECQRPMDRPCYIMPGRSPISSGDADGRSDIRARNADPAVKRRVTKGARLG